MTELITTGPFAGMAKNAYSVIVCDPPWTFATYSDKGKGKSPERHYTCMSIDDICALPVADLAADNCALFLWTTWPTIFQAEKVINSWGFKYSGLAWEWIKKNPSTGKYAFGAGYITRKNLEACVIARKGKPVVKNRSTRDFLYAPRREHSRKPDEQYPLIEGLFDGPYCDLFSRSEPFNEKWTVWGNEVGKFEKAA